MSTGYKYQCWIIPLGQVTASLAKTESSEITGIHGMFKTRLCLGVTNIPTHNVSIGWMNDEEIGFLLANLSPLFLAYEPEEDEYPEPAMVTISRLGYKLYQPPM